MARVLPPGAAPSHAQGLRCQQEGKGDQHGWFTERAFVPQGQGAGAVHWVRVVCDALE